IDSLRSESNLGNEDDSRFSPLAHQSLENLDVDERFSAARDAVQKKNVATFARAHCSDCRGLRRCWLVTVWRFSRSRRKWIALHDFVFDDNQSAFLQSL